MTRTFHMQTFGCQMNANDADWLLRSLLARGFRQSAFDEADLYILNTCSIRDKAEQKVYSELGRIARMCKTRGGRKATVCVGGCVAQQVGPPLVRRFPQVRLLFGADGIVHAPEAISRLMEEPNLRLSLLDFTEQYAERPFAWPEEDPLLPADGSAGPCARAPAAAFVNIMQGCDNFCTYCIVPFVRGRQKSRSAGAVLDECRFLLDKGAREITLLGQNVNSYGLDGKNGALACEKDGSPFAELLYAVARLPGLERLRFVTSHPKDIAPEVIRAFGELETLCPRLHLPLQSGSDRILRAMNRRYDTARYRQIVRQLRQARPDILLTTDIIVGFPGESEEDFQATMRLMQEADFAASFSFVYSDRPGTRALLLPDKVERSLALERLSRLQEWQNKANDRQLSSMVGKTVPVLFESRSRRDGILEEAADKTDAPAEMAFRDASGATGEKGMPFPAAEKEAQRDEAWQGRTPQGFIVNVALGARVEGPSGGWEGAIAPVRIEAAAKHSLKGKQVGAPW